MIEHRPFNELAGADHGWLKAKHHFSFGEHPDATCLGWGSLPGALGHRSRRNTDWSPEVRWRRYRYSTSE